MEIISISKLNQTIQFLFLIPSYNFTISIGNVLIQNEFKLSIGSIILIVLGSLLVILILGTAIVKTLNTGFQKVPDEPTGHEILPIKMTLGMCYNNAQFCVT